MEGHAQTQTTIENMKEETLSNFVDNLFEKNDLKISESSNSIEEMNLSLEIVLLRNLLNKKIEKYEKSRLRRTIDLDLKKDIVSFDREKLRKKFEKMDEELTMAYWTSIYNSRNVNLVNNKDYTMRHKVIDNLNEDIRFLRKRTLTKSKMLEAILKIYGLYGDKIKKKNVGCIRVSMGFKEEKGIEDKAIVFKYDDSYNIYKKTKLELLLELSRLNDLVLLDYFSMGGSSKRKRTLLEFVEDLFNIEKASF